MSFNNDHIAILRRCLRDEEIDSRQPAEKTHPKPRRTQRIKIIPIHSVTVSRNSNLLIITAFLVLAIVAGCIDKTSDETKEMKTLVRITFVTETKPVFTCEVARSQAELSQGLMFRNELPLDRCMLFVFNDSGNRSFWMKNTRIPLDIIFINDNQSVINVEKGNVELNVKDSDLKIYRSIAPARLVVEINQGMSSAYGVREGTAVMIEYI